MLVSQWLTSLFVSLYTFGVDHVLLSDQVRQTEERVCGNGLTSILFRDHQPARLAERVLRKHPLIDLHVDLPVLFRFGYVNDVSHVDYNGPLFGHVDLTRLQKGHSGGMFSVAYAGCSESPEGGMPEKEAEKLFLTANNAVRDTLEQIDVTHQLVAQYGEQIAFAKTADEVRKNHDDGKISHLIGVEGGHLLGNSLAVLRTYHALGVRYLTLTHVCHNAFADTAGSTGNKVAKPLHGGLSALGRKLVREMNRIGMIVDVSHTSDDTARQAIELSTAPVIFSHSGARAVFNHTRNVPDDVLEMISERSGRDSVVGVPVLPAFIGQEPTLHQVADHVEHIARIAGKSRVAIGTDFDGFLEPPIKQIEDVSMYTHLLAELAARRWTEAELAGLVSGNFLRVFDAVQGRADRYAAKGEKADTVEWKARPDLKRRI